MNVRVENAGPCRKVMYVQVPGEALASDYDEILTAVTKVARVKGFRAGKAPAAVVERNFKKHIDEEAKDRLVPRSYRAALEQEKIHPVAVVSVGDVSFEKAAGLTFDVTLDVAPEFKLPRYKRISLKRQAVEIADKDVDDAIQRVREQASRFEDVEGRAVAEGDLAQVDYRGESDGEPVASFAPDSSGIGEGEDFWVMVGEPEFLPGFNTGLIGAMPGESRSVTVQFPADYNVDAVAGKSADYTVEVKKIRERVPAAIDEAFLKQFEVEDENALRRKIREQLQETGENTEKARLKEEIVQFLLAKTKLDLPQSVVQQETQLTVRNMLQRLSMQGATREQIEAQRDDIMNSASETSTDRVRISYILSRIGDAEDVNVEDNELEEHIASLAVRYRMTAEKMRGELEKNDRIESLRSDVRAEKTLDLLLEKAKIKGK